MAGAAGASADVADADCDGVGADCEGVGADCDGVGALDEGVGALDEGVGVLGEGVGVLGDGVGLLLAVGLGPDDRVTPGEVGWPLPGLLPPVADGLLPGVKPGELVTTTVADACAVPICAVTMVVPGPTPVTRPDESTVATAGFPVVQAAPARICGDALLPPASWPVNGGWVLAAVPIRSVRGSMVSEWIWMVMPWGVGRVAWSEVKALAQRASRAMVAPAGLTAAR